MLICEGLLLIFGLIALITGKFQLTTNRVVCGRQARLIGLILLSAPVAGFLTGVFLGVTVGLTEEALSAASTVELGMLVFALAYVTIATSKAHEQLGPAQVPNHRLFSVDEVADYLKLSEAEVLDLIQRGELNAKKIGAHYRIKGQTLSALLRSH